MPPRYLAWLILLFWFGTTAYLVRRDLWPRAQTGEPPPFAIDLVDEARQLALPTYWSIVRQDGLSKRETWLGRLRTWVTYQLADDTFTLQSEMERIPLALGLEVSRLASSYRVDREGRLCELTAYLTANVNGVEVLQGEFEGVVRNQWFHASGRWQRGILDPILGSGKLSLKPVPVSANGSMLNPLHPMNRIAGLQLGQRWRMPLVDPLADALAATFPGLPRGPQFLDAQVLPELQALTWRGREVACLVIEYHHERELSARTWVRPGDGLVLRQEADLNGETLILQRE